MRLHKITLENIRSYASQEIVFPEGKVLLWGNIGSGKSTILLAIDFVLFGLQRTELSGNALLRNGAESGSVELTFFLDGEEITIQRTLKRTRNGIVQDAGYIIRNGVKEEKTALELKQLVLDLLHYPKELLTKTKSLIYRYTVYTPQEEMKLILLGSKEERLDTLRKVFGVDKYKRVKENCKVVVGELKEKKKLYEGLTADLPEKLVEKERLEKEVHTLQVRLQQILPLLEAARHKIVKKKEDIAFIEAQREEMLRLKRDIAVLQAEMKHVTTTKDSDAEKLVAVQHEIQEMQKEELVLDENISVLIQQANDEVVAKEVIIREMLNKIQEYKTRKMHSAHIRQKIESLNTCPTCFQDVSHGYKQQVIDKSAQEIYLFDKDISQHELSVRAADEELKLSRVQLDALKKRESDMRLVRMKLLQLERKKEEFTALMVKVEGAQKRMAELQASVTSMQQRLDGLQGVDVLYPAMKQELDALHNELLAVEGEKQRTEATLRPMVATIYSLIDEINRKMSMREKKEYINKVHFWLTEHFMPLMDTMEKNILYKVHTEFNSLFEKWFSILIDNQTLQMALDEEYSPKIIQNGYDIEYEFLSGGEKTAGALAYRLALNQVINDLNSGLKTRDLLILDEPTDGFSHEQLDRLKVLMDEIHIPQIVLVSHEPQIECFVDTVIRLEKTGHETRIVA